jgi:hypothetical protein
MALKGRKTLHGRLLPSKEEAVLGLRRITGQDFGMDAAQWMTWIKANRQKMYRFVSQ